MSKALLLIPTSSSESLELTIFSLEETSWFIRLIPDRVEEDVDCVGCDKIIPSRSKLLGPKAACSMEIESPLLWLRESVMDSDEELSGAELASRCSSSDFCIEPPDVALVSS